MNKEFHCAVFKGPAVMKTCRKCKAEKNISEFHKRSSNQDGLSNHCKSCFSDYYVGNIEKIKANSVAWHQSNKDKKSASRAAWFAANKDRVRAYDHNRRARERKNGGRLSPGLVDKLFSIQRGKCACGCKQDLGTDYHLDHIMPLALGGSNTDDNIQLLTATCNMQKSKKHPVDFMQQRGFLL